MYHLKLLGSTVHPIDYIRILDASSERIRYSRTGNAVQKLPGIWTDTKGRLIKSDRDGAGRGLKLVTNL